MKGGIDCFARRLGDLGHTIGVGQNRGDAVIMTARIIYHFRARNKSPCIDMEAHDIELDCNHEYVE